jgi:hypothetical protein
MDVATLTETIDGLVAADPVGLGDPESVVAGHHNRRRTSRPPPQPDG